MVQFMPHGTTTAAGSDGAYVADWAEDSTGVAAVLVIVDTMPPCEGER